MTPLERDQGFGEGDWAEVRCIDDLSSHVIRIPSEDIRDVPYNRVSGTTVNQKGTLLCPRMPPSSVIVYRCLADNIGQRGQRRERETNERGEGKEGKGEEKGEGEREEGGLHFLYETSLSYWADS